MDVIPDLSVFIPEATEHYTLIFLTLMLYTRTNNILIVPGGYWTHGLIRYYVYHDK